MYGDDEVYGRVNSNKMTATIHIKYLHNVLFKFWSELQKQIHENSAENEMADTTTLYYENLVLTHMIQE